MCELSDFYLKFVKDNSNPNPIKPPLMLKKEDYQKFIKFLNKHGRRM